MKSIVNVGVILAAGLSHRFNGTVHKQYLKINGKEMIYYSIKEMRESSVFDAVIAVVDCDEYNEGYIASKYKIDCIKGGDTRNLSIKNALDYVNEKYGSNVNILFHDCDRPFVKSTVFKNLINMLKEYDGVAMMRPIRDSLVTLDGDFVDRRQYNLIQTPEAFRMNILAPIFDESSKQTAIINQLSADTRKYFYFDKSSNFKVIYPEDLFLAEQLMRVDYVRYDDLDEADYGNIGKVLLLGGSGGVGGAIQDRLKKLNITYFAPSHGELDLYRLSVEKLDEILPFEPDVIINVAAAYANDDAGLIETFDEIFNVNLLSNLVVIEYAKKLNKRVNIVVMSSSSSTRGRENLTNYSAAKAALNSIVESQGLILSQKNIYLNAIIPEKIDTPLIRKLHKTNINKRELLDVDEVVDAVLTCATSDSYGKLIHVRKGL